MPAWDKCNLAEDQLKAFTRSAVRMKTILCLMEGEMDSGDLEKMTGTRASTILHTIKDLVEEKLVVKGRRGYTLTNIGRIQATLLDDLVGAIVALDQHKDFWLIHDLSGIPSELQKSIGMLAQSDVVIGDPAAILRAQEYFMESVRNSKEVRGVSPIIIPGYAEAIIDTVKNGAQVDLVLTDSTLSIVLRESKKALKDLIKRDNFRLYRIGDGIKVAFTVTDAHLYLGLYMLDGSYDLGRDLFCTGKGATEWGNALFDFYFHVSEPVLKI